jgi:hypothetical protein
MQHQPQPKIQAPQPLPESHCALCGIEATEKCAKCPVNYCSPEHQKIDAGRHRFVCGKNLQVKIEPSEEENKNNQIVEHSASYLKNQKKKMRMKKLKMLQQECGQRH